MVATAPCQFPQPSGTKITQIAEPMAARILSFISTMPKLPSAQPKFEANHTRIVASRIMVPAFLMKDQPRSHMEWSRLPAVGQ